MYDEPKRLVADGLAEVQERFVGKRRSREYSITADGRAALAAWLSEPAEPRITEFEAMVKVFFADGGDLEQLERTLAGIEEETTRRLDLLGELAAEAPAYPSRAHLRALCLPLQLENELGVLTWVRWAREQIGSWESTTDPAAWDAVQPLVDLRAAVETAVRPGA